MDELTKMEKDLKELKRNTDLMLCTHERNSRIRKAIGFIESTANVHLDKIQKLMIEGELSGLITFGMSTITNDWTDKIQEDPDTTEPETTEPEEEEEELDPDEQWAESEEAQELAEEEYKEDLQSYYSAIK